MKHIQTSLLTAALSLAAASAYTQAAKTLLRPARRHHRQLHHPSGTFRVVQNGEEFWIVTAATKINGQKCIRRNW